MKMFRGFLGFVLMLNYNLAFGEENKSAISSKNKATLALLKQIHNLKDFVKMVEFVDSKESSLAIENFLVSQGVDPNMKFLSWNEKSIPEEGVDLRYNGERLTWNYQMSFEENFKRLYRVVVVKDSDPKTSRFFLPLNLVLVRAEARKIQGQDLEALIPIFIRLIPIVAKILGFIWGTVTSLFSGTAEAKIRRIECQEDKLLILKPNGKSIEVKFPKEKAAESNLPQARGSGNSPGDSVDLNKEIYEQLCKNEENLQRVNELLVAPRNSGKKNPKAGERGMN